MRKLLIVILVVAVSLSVVVVFAGNKEEMVVDTELVRAQPGDRAWNLIQERNSAQINMNKAVYLFKQLNNGVELRVGDMVEVPIIEEVN